jgi:antitoxin component YwqK of YwqJK toxin-antitoxin module
MGKPLTPKRVELDTNYDGKVDRIEMYDSEGRLQRVDIDTKGNGTFDQWFIYENGKPKMMGKYKNGDGKTDTWVEY